MGEAPGHQEARYGKPFVGPSGKLLDTVLAHHGINRRSVYVDNVVACRPPDNRPPTKDEIRCCGPRVEHEVAIRSPSTVVCLGNTPSKFVLGTETGITSLRVGPPRASSKFPGAKVIPTVHPAYCLRTSDAFPFFVRDLGKINGASIPWQAPIHRVFENPTEAVAAIEQLQTTYQTIVVDIECGIDKDAAFDHPDHYQMLCIGFAYEKAKVVIIGEKALQAQIVRDALRKLFRDTSKKWIAHNGKFDMAALQSWGMGTNLYFDTMLASYALDERTGTNGLKYNAVEELGAPQYDDELDPFVKVKGGKDFTLAPRDLLYKYNAYDVACTWDLYELYSKQLEEEGLRTLHDFMCHASMGLMFAEMAGVNVDMTVLDELTIMYLRELELSRASLKRWVDNPNSWQQVQRALAKMNIKVSSTREEVLVLLSEKSGLQEQTYEFIDKLLKHRKLAKFYGTYVKGIRERLRQGKVHTSFLVHGTTTGRLSSRNPNLQNIPRGASIRRMFIPAPGNVFVQADYGQVELRVAAVLSGDDYLCGVFSDTSRDLFDELGVALHGPKALDPALRKEIRIKTKAYVYGVNYGRSAWDIAKEFRIPQEEAQKGINTYFELAHQLNAWRLETMNQILDDTAPDLQTLFGKRRRFWLITKANQQDVLKQGLAFIPQSTASDINLLAATRLRLDHSLDTRILVHDSTLVECKEEDAEATSALMCEVMSATAAEVMGDKVPFLVEASIGKSWGEV